MKTIKIKNTSYFIPTKWSEITLNDYLNLRTHLNKASEINDEEIKENDFNTEFINIMTKISIDEIREFSIEEVDEILTTLKLLAENKKTINLNPIFIHKGINYVFDEEMIYGQLVDLNAFTKEQELFDVSHLISAVFMRPAKLSFKNRIRMKFKIKDFKVDKYDYNSVKERAELFKEKMPFELINTCAAFFLTLKRN